MKTKFTSALSKLFLITIVFVLFSGFTNQTNNTAKEILLKGSLYVGQLRSLNQEISVSLDEGFISIYYWVNYVHITIQITDETGQPVYYNVVDPVAGDSLMIDISDWKEGNYTISFSNSSGGCIIGEFELVH